MVRRGEEGRGEERRARDASELRVRCGLVRRGSEELWAELKSHDMTECRGLREMKRG